MLSRHRLGNVATWSFWSATRPKPGRFNLARYPSPLSATERSREAVPVALGSKSVLLPGHEKIKTHQRFWQLPSPVGRAAAGFSGWLSQVDAP